MIDLLTKEEMIEKAFNDAFTKRIDGNHHWFVEDTYQTKRNEGGGLRDTLTELVKKCRDLENDRPLEYTREEIITKFVLEKKPVPDETGNWHLEDWKQCNQVLEHARFLGVLKESKKCHKQ